MIKTPLGTFPTIVAAAKAHKVDRHTLTKRFKTDPVNYVRAEVNYSKLMPWNEYRFLPFEHKETMYADWCKQRNLDPDLASTADAFFDAIDGEAQDAETEDLDAET